MKPKVAGELPPTGRGERASGVPIGTAARNQPGQEASRGLVDDILGKFLAAFPQLRFAVLG